MPSCPLMTNGADVVKMEVHMVACACVFLLKNRVTDCGCFFSSRALRTFIDEHRKIWQKNADASSGRDVWPRSPIKNQQRVSPCLFREI